MNTKAGKCHFCDEGRPFLPGSNGKQHIPVDGDEHGGAMCYASSVYQTKDWDAAYLEFDPFLEDRDVVIECRKVSLVRLRKRQTCVAGGLLDGVHMIEPGMVAKKESAKVDGVFGTCYHCLPCLGRLMAMNGETEDELSAVLGRIER